MLLVVRNIHGQYDHLSRALHMESMLSLEVGLCIDQDSWLQTAETDSG